MTLIGMVLGGSKVEVSVSNCTKSDDEAKLVSIEVSPKSPEKTNTNFTVLATGTTNAAISEGTFKAVAKFLGITVLTEEGDLCAAKTFTLPDKAGYIYYPGIKCPLKEGANVVLPITAEVTSSAPDKKVTINLTVKDSKTKKDVMCIDMLADVKREEEEQ